MIDDGIATGLHSKAEAVGKGARHLAWAIVNNFNDVLKIHSPSKVGIGIGRNFGGSVGMGMMREASTIDKASRYLAYATQFDPAMATPSKRPGVATQPNYGNERPNVHQEITIHTQELDPRRHASQLGWELANRGL
jgi:hypothetical protein